MKLKRKSGKLKKLHGGKLSALIRRAIRALLLTLSIVILTFCVKKIYIVRPVKLIKPVLPALPAVRFIHKKNKVIVKEPKTLAVWIAMLSGYIRELEIVIAENNKKADLK